MFNEEVTVSRPKPSVILEYVDQKTYISEQILSAEAVYAVFYQGKPINLRSLHHLISHPGPKYGRHCFSNVGSAFNLADRLNKQFKTIDFEVVKLTTGVVQRENID
jgi:hypothetical protein